MAQGSSRRFGWQGWLGLALLLISEFLMFRRVPFFAVFFTPLAWTGYILVLDAWLQKRKGFSYIGSRPGLFAAFAVYSIVVWLLFEAYNLIMRNWIYVGLPENMLVRVIGFAWAFATIGPGMLFTSDLLDSYGIFDRVRVRRFAISSRTLVAWYVVGLAFVVGPILFPPGISRYLIAFIWVGYVFAIDPVLGLAGGRSLFVRLREGDVSKLLSLFLAGLICGLLWEFWNYWAATKWVYNVPFLQHPKLFEMPLVGFLGFLPFAVEYYAFWQLFLFLTKQRDFGELATESGEQG